MIHFPRRYGQKTGVMTYEMMMMMRNIPTKTVESLATRMCKKLPKKRTNTLINIVMKWIVDDTSENLRREERTNTRIWRENIVVIRQNGAEKAFKRVWRRERKKYKQELLQKRRGKIQFLTKKYSKKRNIPDELDGVTFSTEPRLYGGAEISDDERSHPTNGQIKQTCS